MLRGLAREDLFTVVLEHFQTDTADYADIVLPATTQLEHWDVHLAYGHHYVTLNRPSIAPLGEALPNSEIFRRHRRADGADATRAARRRPHADPAGARLADARSSQGVTFEALLERGWMRLNVPTPYLPYADGGFPTPSGKCEFVLAADGGDGARSAADVHRRRTSRRSAPGARGALSADADLVAGAQFLNSTFVNVDVAAPAGARAGVLLHPADAERRGDRDGRARDGAQRPRRVHRRWRASSRSIREGVVWAPSIWWGKLAADGANANQTTSQRETDLGHGPVFYDNLVEVGLAD